jgi:signal transduction histidine kinase
MTNIPRRAIVGLLRWFSSIRGRAAVVSVVIVGAAFTVSAIVVVDVLRDSLYASSANTARAEALDITSFITSRQEVPPHLPSAAEEMAAQIIATNGTVLSSSRNIAGQPAMVNLTPSSQHFATAVGVVLHVRRFTHVNLNLDHRFVVAAYGFKSPGFVGTALVAESLGAADHAVGLIKIALETSLPILALLVGLLVWTLTGWALRPVEGIRVEVDELSASDLHRRVQEPKSRDEIHRLARTMNALLGRLEASNDRQRQLVADLSHELRNPLAALRAQLEVSATHPGTTSMALLEGSITDVNRMSQLVEDMLTLARLDEGSLPVRAVDVDLDDLALAQADRLRGRGKVDVSIQGVRAARLRGDQAQLTRVVANLADNAERYAQHAVRFAIVRENGSFEIVVEDDGPGVPLMERERIFERFARLDTARTHETSGAGLGLAIVREIVTAHGGTVWVEDAAPGARFVVRLPAPQGAPE